MSVNQSPFKNRRFKCKWSTRYRRCKGCTAVLMPCCVVSCDLQGTFSHFKADIPLATEVLKVDTRMSFARKCCTHLSVRPRTCTEHEDSVGIQREAATRIQNGGNCQKGCCRLGPCIPLSGRCTVDNTCWGRQRTGHLEVRRVPSWRGNLNEREIRQFPVRGDTRFENEIRT